MEQRDWGKILNTRPNTVKSVRSEPNDLYKKYVLPGGLKVMHVSGRKAVEKSMHLLAESMQDPVLTIDMEWAGVGRPVGLLQIASSTVCVLINARKYWRNKFLPPHLAQLLK